MHKTDQDHPRLYILHKVLMPIQRKTISPMHCWILLIDLDICMGLHMQFLIIKGLLHFILSHGFWILDFFFLLRIVISTKKPYICLFD